MAENYLSWIYLIKHNFAFCNLFADNAERSNLELLFLTFKCKKFLHRISQATYFFKIYQTRNNG